MLYTRRMILATTISHTEGMEAMTGTTNHIHIPKDGIQHIIDALVKFQ